MKKTVLHKAIALLGAITMLAGVAACGHSNNADESGNGLKKVTFMLSWAPDTNHIGVYVAKNKGAKIYTEAWESILSLEGIQKRKEPSDGESRQ